VWTEPATGAEARSVRRWARRILPERLVRAGFAMLLVFVGVVALGRLYYALEPEPSTICVTSDCPPPGGFPDDPPPSPYDIWDAIF